MQKNKISGLVPDIASEDLIQEENSLVIAFEDEAKIEMDILATHVTSSNKNNSENAYITRELEKVKQEILNSLLNVKAMAQLEVVKKCIRPIKPKRKALEDCSSRSQINSKRRPLVPANKNILPQRQFYATKKTKQSKKASVKRPTHFEAQNMTLSITSKY